MDKIPKQHIDFLEFISKEVYSESQGWSDLDLLMDEYNKESSVKLKLDDVRHFATLYKNKYFKASSQSDLKIFPLPEIKQGIETHGSLLKYLQHLNLEKTNSTKRRNLTTITPIVIAVVMLLSTIYFGISNDSKRKEIRSLETKINKMDSIILDLKKQLIINDTLIKH